MCWNVCVKSPFCVYQNARWNERKFAPKIIQNVLKKNTLSCLKCTTMVCFHPPHNVQPRILKPINIKGMTLLKLSCKHVIYFGIYGGDCVFNWMLHHMFVKLWTFLICCTYKTYVKHMIINYINVFGACMCTMICMDFQKQENTKQHINIFTCNFQTHLDNMTFIHEELQLWLYWDFLPSFWACSCVVPLCPIRRSSVTLKKDWLENC